MDSNYNYQNNHMSEKASTSPQPTPMSQEGRHSKENKSIYLQKKASDEFQVEAPQGYQFVKTIGDGSFGKVKLGIHKLTGEKVAIKILCKDRIKEKTDIERISRQIKIMKAIRYPFVIQTYEIIQSPKFLFLIMEYVQGGDLFDAISNSTKLSQETTQTYFSQIILGLEYLHNVGIAHRDMKPENILIDEYGKIKIADFGLGNFFSEGQKLRTACGSPCYAPPQMLNQEEYNPPKVDIWSSGIILYAMIHGYLPFQDDIQTVLYEKIKTRNVRIASSVSIPCRNLIRGLLIKDPNERWNIEIIKNHEFLSDSVATQEHYVEMEGADLNVDQFKGICEHLGILEEDHNRLFNSIKKNKHNNLTTLYYLGKKALLRKIIEENFSGNKEEEIKSDQISAEKKQEDKKQDEQTEKDEKGEVFNKIYLDPEIEKRPFTFCEKKEEGNDHQKVNDAHLKENSQPRQEKLQRSKEILSPSENSKELDNNISHSRNIPQQCQSDQTKQEIIQQKDRKQRLDPQHILERNKINSYSGRPSQSNYLKNQRKQSDNMKKSQVQEIIQKNEPKTQLKKSQRMIMYRPKDEASKQSQGEIKLYERSHSKDRPIILKNNFKTDKHPTIKKKEDTCRITSKQTHIEPHIIDADRIVLCSGEKLCDSLSKKGYSGKIEYYSYNKDCIFVTKSQLNAVKPGMKSYGHELEKVIIQINQSFH